MRLLASVIAACLCGAAFATVEQVRIALTGVDGEMVMSWVTDRADHAGTVVKVGTDSQKFDFGVFNGTSSYYSIDDYTSGDIHFATVTGLQADKQYFYTVGDENEFSNEYSFTTPKAGPHRVTFGLIGDIGQTQNSATTGKALSNDPNHVELILHVGDLSYADGDQPRWDSYGRLFEYLSATTPWMVLPGNHEDEYVGTPFQAYQARFQMPYKASGATEGNLYWSMDYSWAHFVALSTESDFSKGSDQYNWFINDMEKMDRTKTPWLIVMFHRPYYNTNYAHQGEIPRFRPLWEPLFKKYCVDVVLSGHVHAYERSYPVYENEVGDNFPIYLNIGDGGNREGLASDWYQQTAWSAFRKAAYGYTRWEMFNETHLEHSWFANEYEYDFMYQMLGKMTPLESHVASDHLWIVKDFPRTC